jgi:uroporphyrinogen-III decarboxylase
MKMPTSDYDRSDVNRLLKALDHEEPDRVPHIELWVTSKAVYEHVLERKLEYAIGDAATGEGHIRSPSHDYLLPETPLENVIALYETVRDWGYYQ